MEMREEIKALIKQKDGIENEIKELMGVLSSQKGVGLHESLVDSEGYPRADIDVYSVRHARHRILCLQTDHKELMKQIEEKLHRLHAETGHHTQEVMDQSEPSLPCVDYTQAFVQVDRVEAGSPAEQGGLEVHDLIVQFGSVSRANFEDLQTVGRLVHHSRDQAVPLTVIRNRCLVQLSIMPKTWSGRGLLGCNIIPVSRND